MPDYKTKMNTWEGSYAPLSPIRQDSGSDPWADLASKLIPGVIEAAGKGYAEGRGQKILGMDTTAEQAQQAVEDFDAAIPFTQDPSNTPDQRARIEDMRTAALKKFGTDDKKLQALVSSGKISTLEANARRHQMLQDNLSNPILAMFKEDFLDASTAFTGGGGKAAEQYWGAFLPTQEEKVAAQANQQIVKAQADFEEAIAKIQISNPNITREGAISFMQEGAAKEQKLAEAEYNHKMRTFNSQESFVAGMQVVDNFAFNTFSQIAQYAASGKKIDDPATVKAQTEMAKQEALKRLSQFASTMTPDDYNKTRAALEKHVTDIYKLVDDADAFKAFEKGVNYQLLNNQYALGKEMAKFIKAVPDVMVTYKISQEFGDMYMKSQSGDMGAKLWLKTTDLGRRLAPLMGHVDIESAQTAAFHKIANGDSTNWTMPEGISLIGSILTPGNVKGGTDGLSKAPEAARQAFRAAAQNPEATLKLFSDSDEWMANAQTKEGAKINAVLIQEFVSKAKSAQLLTGKGIPSNIQLKGTPQIDSFSGNPTGEVFYQFNTKDLGNDAKRELAQAYKILSKSPQTLKELGYATPEEFINQAFK